MSKKIDRVLRELYPDSESFTSSQRAFAERAIAIANRDAQRSRIPRRDVRIGETFLVRGVEYECIRRPRVLEVSDACSGCAFLHASCPAARCSCWDREDGNNVWFREVEL